MKTIVSLSGGLDSATLLASLIHTGDTVSAVAFRYGSKHNPVENECAQAVARYYGVPFRLVDLTVAFAGFRSNLLQSGGAIPEGHYNDETMRQTVVPCRNIIFLSFLAGLAESEDAESVAIGIHSGDHHIYPDCRPAFYDAMDRAVQEGTDHKVRLYAPFVHMSKTDLVKWGVLHNVPYHLTRTCYTSSLVACGACGSCRERLEAFHLAGYTDPLSYTTASYQNHP